MPLNDLRSKSKIVNYPLSIGHPCTYAIKTICEANQKLSIVNYPLSIGHPCTYAIKRSAKQIKNCQLSIINYQLSFLSPDKLASPAVGKMMFKTVNYPCVLTAANIKTVALCKGEHFLR